MLPSSAVERSTALPWLSAWMLLIVYASLFPFDGWRLSAGASAWQMLALPWPPWRVRFDEIANLLGYLPLGALACYGLLRARQTERNAWALSVLAAACLSYGVEVTQGFLPSRVPSLKDTAFNVVGAAIGAAALIVLGKGGTLVRLQAARSAWFDRGGAVASMLLTMWPIGLLFPAPVPLGLGHGWATLANWTTTALEGTPFQAWGETLTAAPLVNAAAPMAIAAEHELAIVAVGLLAPCLVAYATISHVKRRVLLAFGALFLAIGVTTLSVALTFGPEHALAWVTPNVMIGLGTGTMFSLLCVAIPPRASAWLGALTIAGLVVAVGLAPTDPYYAERLSTWEQGQFIRFHGVSQWVGWLWPYVAWLWLVDCGWRGDEP